MSIDEFNKHKLDMKILHRNWRMACAEAFAIMAMASPGEVVCIAGPSRVGKSKLISELVNLICGGYQYEETGKLPVVVVEAANTGPNGVFATKSFIQRMLDAIKHPTMSLGEDIEENLAVLQKIERLTEANLRLVLEKGFIARGTRYLIIDEAQHVKYAGKESQAPHAVMDSWKCLAQSARLVLVLVGAYPILNITKNSGHLTGRKHQIHFPRYYQDKSDKQEFASIILSYEENLKMDSSLPSLLNCGELLYESTFGCIGLLRAWLSRASAIANVQGTGITLKILQETQLSEAEREVIAAEIYEGEALLANNRIWEDECKSRKKSKEDIKTNRSRNVKPFQRKPVRFKPGNRTNGGDS